MSRRIAAALLLQLFGWSLAAQESESAQKIRELREALQVYREKKDLLGEAITLLRLGVAEADRGNVDSARSNLTDAARKMRALNDALGTWSAHFARSHVENAVGRPKEAIAQIEKALAVTDGMLLIPQEHAQPVDMLRDPKFAAPRYRAAFFLTGDPRGNWKRSSS